MWHLQNNSPEGHKSVGIVVKVTANQEDVTAAHELIVQVVRGELPLQALQSLGIVVRFEDGEVFLSTQVDDFRKLTWGVEVTHAELAHGLLRYAGDPPTLQRWGRFVMASEIGFGDTFPDHDFVKDALWDAAFAAYGNVIGANTLARLQQIAEGEGESGCE